MTLPKAPDLVIGGAPRSGTTFLCECLAKHPGCFVARPFIPEPKVLMTPHPEGDMGYRARYAALFADAPTGRVLIEKTSYYFENAAARGRFARVLPRARILFILRDPVARAYSNWLWSRRNGLETLGFAEAIAAERRGDRVDPLPAERSYARPFDYLARARYGSFARDWIAAIGRERMGIFLFEDIVAASDTFTAALQRFAGVEALPWAALKTGAVNATSPLPADLDPALLEGMREELRSEMELLRAATGLDATRWGF